MNEEKAVKKVVMVYGYGEGAPWFPAVRSMLEGEGCEVIQMKMPRPWFPSVKEWVKTLQEAIPDPDEQTYLIGYSIGACSVLRCIEELRPKDRLGGVVAVAFFSQYQLNSHIPTLITRSLRPDLIKGKVAKIGVVQSSNDWRAPVSNGKWLVQNVGGSLSITHRAGHFDHQTDPPYEIVKMVQKIILRDS